VREPARLAAAQQPHPDVRYTFFRNRVRQPLAICCELHRKHLDCHLATNSRVEGAIDLSHSTGPDKGDEFVRPQADCRAHSHVSSRRISAPAVVITTAQVPGKR
jgi:hypothetical protein